MIILLPYLLTNAKTSCSNFDVTKNKVAAMKCQYNYNKDITFSGHFNSDPRTMGYTYKLPYDARLFIYISYGTYPMNHPPDISCQAKIKYHKE